MDRDIADRMRSENIEQFHTLVRMHLSFELDLNTDTDNDGVFNVKAKTKKRFNFPKKLKNVTSSKSSGTPFNVGKALSTNGIQQIRNIIAFLMLEQNIIQEGIFRRTGSVARQNDLRRRINENTALKFDDGVFSVHDCASVLKGILSDLPEPLLTDTYYAVHCQIAELCNNGTDGGTTKEQRLLHSIQLLLLLLPLDNRSLLHDIINMLHETTKYEANNKMSAESLATLFSPHLICPRKLAPESLHTISQNMSGVISFMITKGTELQDVPTKLATDIRAYFVEQRRKRVLSPEMQLLDVSVTSDSVANTVFTFIDREKTAEAHISNPTDTALAQLYAFIQTLPESSKKRKLVKQFNKENGQGTPLQTQMLLRLKKNETNRSSKSLSGSIKKHIFHNTLVSKTPKRCSTTSTGSNNTPTNSRPLEEITKPRIVFQTPTVYENRAKISSNEPFQMPAITLTDDDANQQHHNPISSSTVLDSINDDVNAATLIDNKENEQSNQKMPIPVESKPINNKYKTFFKSEPNLSKILLEKNSTPIINRGKHIAKKLFSSVSMTNLPIPFCGPWGRESIESQKLDDQDADFGDVIMTTTPIKTPTTAAVTKTMQRKLKNPLNCVTSASMNQIEEMCSSSIANDSSKDLSSADEMNTIDSIGGESESPITKSTHRMSKAMQESIMTPRSRKPVIIGAMLGLPTENYRKNFLSLPEDGDELLSRSKDLILNSSLYKSKSEGDLLDLQSNDYVEIGIGSESNELEMVNKGASNETLTTPFRKYLFSRSLLTTTPVDSSFSSQSDDFENLNDSEMSESLIYCLNGNEPESQSPQSDIDEHDALLNITTQNEFRSSGRKRAADISSGCSNDNLFCDYNNGKAKKNHIELDETAL